MYKEAAMDRTPKSIQNDIAKFTRVINLNHKSNFFMMHNIFYETQNENKLNATARHQIRSSLRSYWTITGWWWWTLNNHDFFNWRKNDVTVFQITFFNVYTLHLFLTVCPHISKLCLLKLLGLNTRWYQDILSKSFSFIMLIAHINLNSLR